MDIFLLLRRPEMSFLKKLFWWKRNRPARVRICVECGMPVGEHKGWCSIFRTMQDLQKRATESAPSR